MKGLFLKRGKTVLCLLLSICLCLGQITAVTKTVAAADEGADVIAQDGLLYQWDAERSGMVMYGLDETFQDTTLAVPETVGESHLPVVAVADGAASGWQCIETVQLPPTIQRIGAYAFSGCSNMTDFVMEDMSALESVGVHAFEDTAMLENLKQKSGDDLIMLRGGSCFIILSASSVETMSFMGAASSVFVFADFAAAGSDSLEKFGFYSGTCSIGAHAFENCASLKVLFLQDGVKFIGEKAFANCTALELISLPDQVKSIGREAFANCMSAQELILRDHLETIGERAFANCTGLTYVLIPDDVTTIEKGAFESCKSVKNVELGKGVSTIPEKCFADCTALCSVRFSSGVQRIESSAFSNCSGLKEALIPEQVESIASAAFLGCDGMERAVVANPDCVLEGQVFPPGTLLVGHAQSTLKEYAQIYGNPFEQIEGAGSGETTTTTVPTATTTTIAYTETVFHTTATDFVTIEPEETTIATETSRTTMEKTTTTYTTSTEPVQPIDPEKQNPYDVDDNPGVDLRDAAVILKIYAFFCADVSLEENGISMETVKRADVNGDGSVDISDAVLVIEYYAKQAAGLLS